MAILKVLCRSGSPHATVTFHGQTYPALIGASGPIAPANKREGDGATPLGTYPLTHGYYRADRLSQPNQTFPWQPIKPGDGWTENPDSDNYNRFEHNPAENAGDVGFFKQGPQRDVIIVIGYNTNPIVAGKGSAVFIHPIPPGAAASRGCVMLSPAHTAQLAAHLQPGDEIHITLA